MGADDALIRVWTHARDVVGLLGPGPVEVHLEHARGFAPLLQRSAERVLDLGSGAGVPGLALAMDLPGIHFTLLDGSAKRSEFLRWAVAQLGLDNVDVVEARAEDAGRRSDLRESFDAVVSRSFASPAVTAECAAPLLAASGLLIVSEPPDAGERWPVVVSEFGLSVMAVDRFAVLEKVAPTPDRFPRRNGIPAKRPLF